MNFILKKFDAHYHLFSDKRAEFAQYSIANNKLEQVGRMSDKGFHWIDGRPMVVASTKKMNNLPLLNQGAINILLGEADVKALASEWALKSADKTMGINSALNRGFIAGYNKCLELNSENKFTIDDMAKMIRWLSVTGKFLHAPTGNIGGNRAIVEQFMRSQKTAAKMEWQVQIEVNHMPDGMPEYQPVPTVTNGYITIIKILN